MHIIVWFINIHYTFVTIADDDDDDDDDDNNEYIYFYKYMYSVKTDLQKERWRQACSFKELSAIINGIVISVCVCVCHCDNCLDSHCLTLQ